jgi:hypothetical protein
VIVLVLTLMAVSISPLRQLCGLTCTEPHAAAVQSVDIQSAAPVAELPCHKPAEPEPAPPPAPDAEHCTHDHTGSLRPATRAAIDAAASQPLIAAMAVSAESLSWTRSVLPPSLDLSGGSPPPRFHTPLRI